MLQRTIAAQMFDSLYGAAADNEITLLRDGSAASMCAIDAAQAQTSPRFATLVPLTTRDDILPAMITIYHSPGTRSIRVIWLCEELALPYDIVPVDFSAAYRATDEWRRLNPVGKVPALRDDDFTMFESGAMVEYLLERYGRGRLRPAPGTRDSAFYFQWTWFAEATFARPLGDIAQHTIVKPEAHRIAAVVDDGRTKALTCLDALEAAVPGGSYLVNDTFTAADIMMGYTLILARRFKVLTPTTYTNVNAYMARLEQHPGFVKAQS